MRFMYLLLLIFLMYGCSKSQFEMRRHETLDYKCGIENAFSLEESITAIIDTELYMRLIANHSVYNLNGRFSFLDLFVRMNSFRYYSPIYFDNFGRCHLNVSLDTPSYSLTALPYIDSIISLSNEYNINAPLHLSGIHQPRLSVSMAIALLLWLEYTNDTGNVALKQEALETLSRIFLFPTKHTSIIRDELKIMSGFLLINTFNEDFDYMNKTKLKHLFEERLTLEEKELITLTIRDVNWKSKLILSLFRIEY